MPRWLTKRRMLLLTTVVLGVAALLPPPAARAFSSAPRWVVRAATGWISRPFTLVAGAVRGRSNLPVDRGDPRYLEQNYDALLKYNAYLLDQWKRTRQELEHYRWARQNLPPERKVDFILADVTAWFGDALDQTLTLNQGAGAGVATGMIVVDAAKFSLLGRVSDVGPGSASVAWVASPAQRVLVQFLPSAPVVPPAQPAQEYLQGRRDGRALVATLKTDAPVQVGYLAHLFDPRWPKEAQGFVVGKVTALEPLPDNPFLFNRVVVEPIYDPTRLDRVIVLVPVNP